MRRRNPPWRSGPASTVTSGTLQLREGPSFGATVAGSFVVQDTRIAVSLIAETCGFSSEGGNVSGPSSAPSSGHLSELTFLPHSLSAVGGCVAQMRSRTCWVVTVMSSEVWCLDATVGGEDGLPVPLVVV